MLSQMWSSFWKKLHYSLVEGTANLNSQFWGISREGNVRRTPKIIPLYLQLSIRDFDIILIFKNLTVTMVLCQRCDMFL